MRLKFLFFPIMIIISLFVFIGYIWPEITNLSLVNEEKLQKKAALEAIAAKKSAIGKVESQISSNSEGAGVINDFLPSNKVEERILTDVNFLADDSSVSLVNIALEDAKEEQMENNATMSASLLAQTLEAGNTADPLVKKEGVQYTRATISLIGEYEKIRLFMESIQKAKIFNTMRSVTINKQQNVIGSDGNPIDNGNLLTANIVVDFGWMDTVKLEGKKIEDVDSQLDQKTITLVQQYINQKGPEVETLGNAAGKKNPFVE